VRPETVTYVQKLLSDMADPTAGNVYNVCGSAAAATTIAISYSASFPAFSTSVNSSSNPVTDINILPIPDATGVDKLFDHLFIHQFGLGLRVRTWAAPFASAAQYGFVTSGPLADEEGFAETCADFELKKLSTTGRRTSDDQSQGFDTTLLIDTFNRFDPSLNYGQYSDPGPRSIPYIAAGGAVYRMIIGPQGTTGLAAYETSYYAALTGNQGPLLPSDRQMLFDSLATIDGSGAGDWIATFAPYLLGPVTPNAGTQVIAWLDVPQVPNTIVVQAADVETAGDGNTTYTPITSGAVTITVNDVNGTQVAQFTSDLSQSLTPGNVTVNLASTLSVGVYNVQVTATANGQNYSVTVPIAVVPTADDGSIAVNQAAGAPLIYAVSVDGSGNAANDTLTATEGTVVYPNGGGTIRGLAIIQPAASGEVTVNGQRFVVPTIGSRVVFVSPGF
jgi:hypothetical protein